MPITPYKDWKVKLKRTHFSKVQSGKITLCIFNNVFSYYSSILFRAHALWALSKSKRNKAVIRRAGGLPLIAKLVKVRHTSILIPVIGTLQECASEKAYCLAIMQSEGMIADLVRNLGTESPKLKMLCASAMYVLITCFHESWIFYKKKIGLSTKTTVKLTF